jgi:hypothetical protein
MKKIITFLVVLFLFDSCLTKTYIKDGVLWQTQGKPFKDNYKKGSGRLVKNKRFNPYLIKDS